MKKLTDILENKNVILDENSDASLEILLTEAEVKPPENTDVGIVLSRLSDMISMSDDLYDTASSLEEIDKETAEAVEATYNSLDELYAMFDDKYDIFRSDFDMGDIEMDEDFRISLDDLLNEATDELSEAGGMGDWVVINLDTKKTKYFKTYGAASKFVKKNGGVIASSEYYADNKKKFESMHINGAGELAEQKNLIQEDKYTELGLSVNHNLNMAQTFWWKLSKGSPKSPKKTFLATLTKYIQKNKVTYKKMPQPLPTYPVMYTLTFKDKSQFQAWVPVKDSKVKDIQIGNADHLAINGTRGNMFHKVIKANDLKLKLKEELAPISEGMSDSTKAKRQAQFNKQAKMDDDDPKAYKPAPGDPTGETKPSQYTKKYKQMYGEKIEGLAKKADETGVSYSILKQVFDRGMAAWKTSHRPGTTPHQWAYARVNSFLTGGKTQSTADADLWAKVSGKKESVELEESLGKSTQSLLNKIGFKEAPINNITKKVLASVSGKKIEPSELFGISMRAGKWADIFVGTNDEGKFFVVDPSGLTLFNKESELVTALKSAALGESINNSIKGTKGLNDIVG